MGRVQDKVVIVTGGASGIGEATVRRLAAEGARLVITDINVEGDTRVATDLGDRAIFVKHDVASVEDWKNVVSQAVTHFGTINALVNNAGIVGPGAAFHEVSDTDFDAVMQVNVFSIFKGMQLVLPAMREAGAGSIVNFSSTAGLVGNVNVMPYVTSKWAVTGMTKAAALELAADNIRVNSVHPGGIKSNIEVFDAVKAATPQGRIGEAKEVANLVLYLVSDESSFSTGAEFVVDGGYTAQ